MPLPFDFEGKRRVLAESYCYYSSKNKEGCFLLGTTSSSCNSEPTSILDTIGSPSPPTSTSTLSSSFGGAGGGGGGGGGSTDTAGVAAVSGNPSQKWPPVAHQENVGVESGCGSSDLHPPPLPLEVPGGSATTAVEKCGMGMEDWESMLSDSVAASPSQEQSFIRWIMGDVEDPSMGLNKLLQSGGGGGPASADFEFNGGFGVVDQGFGLDPVSSSSCGGGGNLMGLNINPCLTTSGFPPNKFNNNEKILGLSPNLPNYKLHNNTPMFSPLSNNLLPISLSQQCLESPPDVKPQIFNPQFLINQHQSQHTQIPAFFLPLSHTQQQQQDQQHLILPPQPKRHNPGGLEPVPKTPFSDSMLPPPQPHSHHQLQLLPHYLQQRPTMGMKPKLVADEIGHNNQHQHQQQQVIIDQLFKAAELVQTGNSVLAQGILARLNHQLSPIGKPFHRAALFCKEALQLLLHTNNNNNNPSAAAANSPYNLIFKIGAYKSFSEISPLLQFANFTCNQALLEVLDGFDRIHIIDFDIGYGGQWASLMQELALRNGGAPSLKITAFASPSTHDQLELGLTRENLMHFAGGINMGFEFEILSLETLHSASWSLPLHISENEAIAVNLPVGSYSNYQLSLPSILRFVKQLSPKIVVSVDRGCDRTDLPFPNHVIHVLQSYSNLLESLDAVNVNLDALQKIERFLLQPGIEKVVMGRYRSPEKTPHWRTLFLSSGFSPLTFSNFTESQAECVIKRTPVRGFHVEKRQTSLVLCWQRKELISASAWRC